MGIRYLAISIDERDFAHLSVGDCVTCGEEPQLRRLDYEEDRNRETLDLDKSWGYFQHVLETQPPRPAAALVHGDVTYVGMDYRSYRGLISAAEVRRVADDLATVTTELVRQRVLVEPRYGDRAQDNFDYVSHFLPEAKDFTRRVANEGRAILYYIG